MQLRSALAGAAATVVAAVGVGLVAPTSVSAAVVHYFSTTRTVSGQGSATCPRGTRLTGGGVGTLPPDQLYVQGTNEYKLTGSWPSGNTWHATATWVRGLPNQFTGKWSYDTFVYLPKVYAVCVS